MEHQDTHEHGSLVQTFALLSAASVAVRIVRSIRDRKAGRDASEQEEFEDAIAGLRSAIEDLQELLLPLFISSAASAEEDEDERVRLVRQFDVLHRAAAATSLLHRVQQHLLSLFPAVSEQRLEEARVLHDVIASIGTNERDFPGEAAVDALGRALALAVELERSLTAFSRV